MPQKRVWVVVGAEGGGCGGGWLRANSVAKPNNFCCIVLILPVYKSCLLMFSPCLYYFPCKAVQAHGLRQKMICNYLSN